MKSFRTMAILSAALSVALLSGCSGLPSKVTTESHFKSETNDPCVTKRAGNCTPQQAADNAVDSRYYTKAEIDKENQARRDYEQDLRETDNRIIDGRVSDLGK